jgi:general secretion pathway protein A
MYLDFYSFREKPFNLTPDPRFIFLSRSHREAFAHLLYGINNRAGFMVLTGEVGSGKTTVLRTLFNHLPADRFRTALIFNPSLSSLELLQSINRELGVPSDTSDNRGPLDALNLFLLQQNAEGRTVVLAIDEAQDLEASVLEQIRLISNLETDRKKLIQIVLAGQPELMRILNRDELRQLSQRITVSYHLEPMSLQETLRYIDHRLKVAGGGDKVTFSKGSLNRIYRYSRGLPRLINAACDRSLLAGYTKDTRKIGSRIAVAGIKDLRRNTAYRARKRRLIWIPVFVLLAALVAVGINSKWVRNFIGQFNASYRMQTAGKLQTTKELQTTEQQAESKSIMMDEELPRPMASELGEVSESESIRYAFNALAASWNIPPILESGDLDQLNRMEQKGLGQGLRLYRFFGNLGTLIRIDCPAVLELVMPDVSGKRFVLLAGIENEKILVDPPIAGRKSLFFGELEEYWSGYGYLLWKNPLNFPTSISSGAKGDYIKRLQGLLREAGAYRGPVTGIYDRNTLLAVKKFQSSMGIEQDGIVGVQTLMLLYRSANQVELPRLTVVSK